MSLSHQYCFMSLLLCTSIGCTPSTDTGGMSGLDLEESISLGVQTLDSERTVMVLKWNFGFSTDLMIKKTMTLDFSGSSILNGGSLYVYGSESP